MSRVLVRPMAPLLAPLAQVWQAPVWLLAGALLLPGPATAEETAMAPEAAAEADAFSGTYDVEGLTVDQRSGDTRRISGHVVLTREDDHWKAAAELETQYPTHGGPMRTDVIGTGEGRRESDGLAGTARTQLVIQTVPGVDTNFAFVPRRVGPRIVSTWTARLQKDGTLLVELVNEPAEGEHYSPTHTTLHGTRVVMPQERRKKKRHGAP
jgi:hypothetical protein